MCVAESKQEEKKYYTMTLTLTKRHRFSFFFFSFFKCKTTIQTLGLTYANAFYLLIGTLTFFFFFTSYTGE